MNGDVFFDLSLFLRVSPAEYVAQSTLHVRIPLLGSTHGLGQYSQIGVNEPPGDRVAKESRNSRVGTVTRFRNSAGRDAAPRRYSPHGDCGMRPSQGIGLRVLASLMTAILPSRSATATAFVLLVVLAWVVSPVRAAVYFVDAELGSDDDSGLTQNTSSTMHDGPWRSLGRVAAATLAPGDEVRLRCGQVWAETLRINQSGMQGVPITIGAYPEPCVTKPGIDGTITIPADNWVLDHGAVYRAQLPINIVTNGTLKRTASGWSQGTNGTKGTLAFNKACSTTLGGCLTFVSPTKVKGLFASPKFVLRPAVSYRVNYSIFVAKNKRVVLRIRRANSANPVRLASLGAVVGNGKWQAKTFDFTSRNGASDARIELEVPARNVTVKLRAVAVKPLTGEPTNLLMSGRALQPAHHPNFGSNPEEPNSVYLKVAEDSAVISGNVNDGSGSTYLTVGSDLVLPPGRALVPGLTIRVRSENWNLDQRAVTAFSNNRVEFVPRTLYPVRTGWGYFFTGADWMVDSPDEWFYQTSTNRLTVEMPDKASPGNRLAYSSLSTGLDLDGLHDVIVDNLAIRGAVTGIRLNNSSRINLGRMQVTDVVERGATFALGQSIAIDNSVFARIGRDAIAGCLVGSVQCGSGNSLTGSTIADSGVQVVAGKVVSLPVPGNAAINLGPDATVSGNKILRTATYGVSVKRASTISRNSMTDTCLVLDDCAGIDSSLVSNQSVFSNNLIQRVWGNINGTPYPETRTVGIYLDQEAQDIVVAGNTIIGADNGIQVHNAFNNIMQSNVLFGNRRNQIWFQEQSNVQRANGDIHGNVVTQNILVPIGDNPSIRQETILADTEDFASYSENIYSTLLGPEIAVESSPAGRTTHTLPTWQSATVNGMPRNSDLTGRAITLNGFTAFRSTGANVVSNGNLLAGLTGWTSFNDTAPFGEISLGQCGSVRCVTLTAGASPTLLSTPNFAVTKDQWYRVSFDAGTGVDNETISVVPRRSTQPFEGLGAGTQSFTGTAAMKRYSFIFKAAISVALSNLSGGRIDFQSVPAHRTLRVANVEMVPISPVDATAIRTAIVVNDDPATAIDVPCPDQATAPANCSNFVTLREAIPVSWPHHLEPLASEVVYTRNPQLVDTDNDGIPDSQDTCPGTLANAAVNAVGCSISQ